MKKTASLVSIIVLALVCFDPPPAFADAPIAAKPRAKKPRKPAKAAPSKTEGAEPVASVAPAPLPPPAVNVPAVPAPAEGDAASRMTLGTAVRDQPAEPQPQLDDADAKHFAAAPLLGYASQSLKLGFGARASYTFSNHITVAGTFVYHLGTSSESSALRGVTASTSVHAFYPGVEVGYDLRFDRITLRPYAGVAPLFIGVSSKVGDRESSDTSSHFAFYPGVTATYDIAQTGMFAGADSRLLIVTEGGDPSVGFFATFGLKL